MQALNNVMLGGRVKFNFPPSVVTDRDAVIPAVRKNLFRLNPVELLSEIRQPKQNDFVPVLSPIRVYKVTLSTSPKIIECHRI